MIVVNVAGEAASCEISGQLGPTDGEQVQNILHGRSSTSNAVHAVDQLMVGDHDRQRSERRRIITS